MLTTGPIIADSSTKDIIIKAMKDEMARNIEQLKLEKLGAPFFISYTIRDVKTTEIKASLGSITSSEDRHFRNHSVKVMVGSYKSNNENFFDMSGGSWRNTLLRNADRLPLEDNYNGIRRALWIATDNAYKKAAEQFERKKGALKQQSLSEDLTTLVDFSKSSAMKHIQFLEILKIDQLHWEEAAKEISSLFIKYPDIFTSEVRIYFYQGNEYHLNSEGTELVRPLTLAAIQINANTQAEDGEELTDHVLHYCCSPSDLPSKNDLKKETILLAKQLVSLRTAPVFDESYTGPIMFEGQAAAEMFAQRLFQAKNGLLAVRKPIVNDPRALNMVNQQYGESLENRIGRRITSRDLTIKAKPRLEEFKNIKFIGHYTVDTEGIQPPEKVTLVENGILQTLLNNRIPTIKVKESNGHQRSVIGEGWYNSSRLGPSVINITSSKGKSDKSIKKDLIQLAKDEGLEYGLLVRKIESPVSGNTLSSQRSPFFSPGSREKLISDPIYVYRVYVKDGREELVRSVQLDDISISALRHLIGVSKKQVVYNILMPTGGQERYSYSSNLRGIPSTFITPHSLILEELEVKKEERIYTPKLPCVASPLKK